MVTSAASSVYNAAWLAAYTQQSIDGWGGYFMLVEVLAAVLSPVLNPILRRKGRTMLVVVRRRS
jgi:hypothetical protein